MNLDYNTIGLEKNLLYEILATTISIENSSQITPNTACMGIRLLNDNLISIRPYPSTKTFQNLKKVPIVILNFVDDIQLYVIMSLKESKMKYELKSSPELYYDFLKVTLSTIHKEKLKATNFNETNSIPFIKSSWAIIICEVEKENTDQKVDQFGTINLTEFLMRPIYIKKLRESYKLYNRAENLVLESIILTTRLKIASEMKDRKSLELIEHKIAENINTITKFNKNERISKSLEYLIQYIEKFKY